jgi:translation initiation factor 6 (eIF-6)
LLKCNKIIAVKETFRDGFIEATKVGVVLTCFRLPFYDSALRANLDVRVPQAHIQGVRLIGRYASSKSRQVLLNRLELVGVDRRRFDNGFAAA